MSGRKGVFELLAKCSVNISLFPLFQGVPGSMMYVFYEQSGSINRSTTGRMTNWLEYKDAEANGAYFTYKPSALMPSSKGSIH
jgi:hypothetical protein